MDAAHLKNQFEEQGFLFLSDFFDNRELKRIKEKVQNYILNIAPGLPSDKVFYEDADDLNSIKQLFHLSDYDVFFKDLLRGSKLEDLARVFFGEDTGQGFVEYFNKPPGIGQPTPPHQDCYYFMLSPPKALTFWIPLEDVDEENGCLRYVRGSHKLGMRPHGRTKTLGFSQGITDFGTKDDIANEVSMPTKQGDVLVHDGMTIHRADRNKSHTRSRSVLGIVYFAESAIEDLEAKKAYEEKLKIDRTK
ncbi:phytanoyl-CoA dioxygenase family protein [Membranicola marinus]|uniref:Phytanoyl-CoA dioxygenase family protein n=1 Tax=Membranihabitans marinus TaxID=1227546 RepID=A0A953HQF3_9BACT|nr:phytanoyl-CoA dioxygenase family protein [Membranihabitans marinus]MBY5956500.1 phytanoyl-CoA dioxygenase family protein [Membranihabitans marinus]